MFYYFGYGSNLSSDSMRAKGVLPISSQLAYLHDWRLLFNVAHYFPHEGGVANVEAQQGAVTEGVLHQCRDTDLPKLDAVEAYGVGYDRVRLPVIAGDTQFEAWAYVGLPGFIVETALPSRRYLNILLAGATAAGVSPSYIQQLRTQPYCSGVLSECFVPPSAQSKPVSSTALAATSSYTALAGQVFDMSSARWQHRHLLDLFGGRDMTLWHLQRMDCSRGLECIDAVAEGRYSPAQREYLNTYLQAYNLEYNYVGELVAN